MLGAVILVNKQAKGAWVLFAFAIAVAAAGVACAVIAVAFAHSDPLVSTAFGRAAGVLVTAAVVYLVIHVARSAQAKRAP